MAVYRLQQRRLAQVTHHTLQLSFSRQVSHGKWPIGNFKWERNTVHGDDAANSKYGAHGNVIFSVPGRANMGIHSGRADTADGLGRKVRARCVAGALT